MINILLLGGFGFISTNIIKYAESNFDDDFSFIVLDKLPSHPDGIKSNCIWKVYSGDFTDRLFLKEIFQNNSIDLIIHSVSSTVPISSQNARFDIESNLIPTVDLLDLMVEFQVDKIVFLSSGGAIYGDSKANVKHKETDEVFPRSSYGVVKLAIEKYLFQYHLLFNIQPLVLRLSNPYGKYHYSQKQGLVNLALKAARNNQTFTVWGNGENEKDYIFIEDFCAILFDLIQRGIYNKILNIGSGEVHTVNRILQTIKSHYPSFTWEYSNPNLLDVKHVELDLTSLKMYLNDFNFTRLQDAISSIK